jgi:hypothetical protein
MRLNSISISTFCGDQNSKTQQRKHSNIQLKVVPQADSFNGKTLKAESNDLLSKILDFTGKKKNRRRPPRITLPEGPYGLAPGEYRNMFDAQLKATPAPDLAKKLSIDNTIYDVEKATLRLTSLSRYLKEEMVGFITPSGHHWFPNALENIINGAKSKKVPESQMKDAAKEFWGLIALADPYWISDDYVKYLSDMKKTPARDATIQAIKELQLEQKLQASTISFTGYKSELKDIPELLESGCAYDGTPMKRTSKNRALQVSSEHIFPRSKGGANNDFNYFLTNVKTNGERSNMPLIDYLKGR